MRVSIIAMSLILIVPNMELRDSLPSLTHLSRMVLLKERIGPFRK